MWSSVAGIVAPAAIEDVIAAAARDNIVAAETDQMIRAVVADERVGASRARDVFDIRDRDGAFSGSGPRGELERHSDAGSIQERHHVATAVPVEGVVTPHPEEDVVSVVADQDIVAFRADRSLDVDEVVVTFTAGPAGGKVHVDAPRACIREVRRVIDEVDTETADEHVCVSTPCKVVVTRASSEHVGSVGAVKPVVPATANQDVLPRLVHHIETVVPGTADEHVVAWVLEAERIVSVLDEVMPSTAAKGIAAAERSDQIVLCSTDHHIVALATADLILARSAADEIVAGGRADEVSIRSAAQLRSSVVLPDAVPAGP